MGGRNWQKKKRETVTIAAERTDMLMELARERALSGDPSKADEYVALAWRVSTRYKSSISREHKRCICRKCGSHLYPGINCRVRLRRGKKIYFCERCQSIKRVPYKK